MLLSRRGFLGGLGVALAAPLVVKAEILMPVKNIIPYSSGIIDEINWYVPARLHGRKLTIAQQQNLGTSIAHEINRYTDRPSMTRAIMKFAEGFAAYGKS